MWETSPISVHHVESGCREICFLVSALLGGMSSCAALGLFFHYFHLSQFSWMLIQAINFWQILVMNDEHTERRYLLDFLLGWGHPALVIIILVVILLGGFGWSIYSVYGLVQGDLGAHDVVSVYSGHSDLSLGWTAHGLQIPVDADPPCYLQHLCDKNTHTI
ncbi:adhesion G-protein coupled receptor V1-like [Cyprinus carpio]|uniref:Adhesion G-protein coupled receptor V1-like n=1 Tax=Cyprinus carpio TaxID=7962 RepID=A0A9R0AW86_CYPCA|nr:adhesion G-protein coupled receptor V1-like [Cyprinus carpio]XP_042612580.1 adhesion G-protein coupled receptor V1-like [Cyprinus carpio]